MTVIIFLIVLAILVFVHELGHFLAAKMSGIRVDEFALGFPPRLISKKVGETEYSLNLIPFGGYVKIHGENGENPDEPQTAEQKSRSFVHKNRFIQVWVLIAGIVFNIAFAWIIVSIGLSAGLPPLTEGLVKSQYNVPSGVIISDVSVGSPAEKSGMMVGDRIIFASVPGVVGATTTANHPNDPQQIYDLIAASKGKPVEFLVVQGNLASFNSKEEKELARKITATPSYDITPDKPVVGIRMYAESKVKVPFPQSFIEGAKVTADMTVETAKGLTHFFGSIFMGTADLSQVSGPVGIATVVGSAWELGITYLVGLTALISINLALINLVPLPALDGGRIVIVIIEGIIRRPLPQKIITFVQVASFFLLILLMVVITVKDIAKFF